MTDDGWLTSRPIAHRGLYDEADGRPENSLAAFARAAELGVPFEFDVQLTRDGHPVVLHDADLDRVVGRTTGRLRDLTLAQVARLRAGPAGAPIPTLEDVLELVDGRVPVVVDVRRWGFDRVPALERAVADRLRGYRGPVATQSFDPVAVGRLRGLLPDVPVGQASGSLPSAGPVRAALGRLMLTNALTRPDFLTYELAELPARPVSFWRRPDRPLLAYTVCSAADERRAARLADGYFFAGYLPDLPR